MWFLTDWCNRIRAETKLSSKSGEFDACRHQTLQRRIGHDSKQGLLTWRPGAVLGFEFFGGCGDGGNPDGLGFGVPDIVSPHCPMALH